MPRRGVRSAVRSRRVPPAPAPGHAARPADERPRLYPCNGLPLSDHLSRISAVPMTSSPPPRLSQARLRLLTEELPDRYTTPLPHLACARLLTGAHLDRLLATPKLSPQTTARVRRRVMTRLHGAGLVAMLARRIGGARAGSAGHVYTLTPAGRAFLALRRGEPAPPRGRRAREPGALFLAHALAISGVYVDVIEASRAHGFTVRAFTTEPECWHPSGTGSYLRPDAYAVVQTRTHADCWWLEIDQATESTPRLRAKIAAYRDYLTNGGTGPHGVPPRVLFTAPDPARAAVIARAAAGVPEHLVTVTTHDQAAQLIANDLHQT
jgi:Replication-relaxation